MVRGDGMGRRKWENQFCPDSETPPFVIIIDLGSPTTLELGLDMEKDERLDFINTLLLLLLLVLLLA